MGARLSHQTNAKLPYLTLSFKSVFTKEKNTLPDFEPVCEANISEVVFSEERVKKKLLNLNPYKSLGVDNLHPRILRDLSVSLSLLHLSYTLNHSNNKSCRKTGRML